MRKTKALFLFIIAVMTTVLLISCGRAEIPEESISYESIPDKTSAGDIASASESETGGNSTESTTDSSSSAVTETEQNEETSGASDRPKPHEPEWIVVDGIVLPEKKDLSSCKIIPEKYDDHGEQLKRLGFSESSDEYILYDAILDISCKGAFYLDYLDGIYYDVYDKANADMFFYPYKVQLEALISDLLSAYGVDYPDRSILPLDFEKNIFDGSIESIEINRRNWNKFCRGKTEALHSLSELFSVIDGWEYANAAETYTAAAVQKAEYAMPFIDDFFFCDTFEIKEDLDKESGGVRVTLTTTCNFLSETFPGISLGDRTITTLGTDANIESFSENPDGTKQLIWTMDFISAAYNYFAQYYIEPYVCNLHIENCVGMQMEYYFHSGYPYAFRSDEYWDTPVKVSHKELDKVLTELFTELKGAGTYTYRDLATVNSVEIRNNDMQRNWLKVELMNNAGQCYPGSKSGAPYIVKTFDTSIEPISENDMALFMVYTQYHNS